MLSLCLYKNRTRLPSGSVVLDAQLNVLSTIDLDPQCVYHVRLGLITDMDYVGTPSLLRVSGQPVSIYLAGAIYNATRGANAFRADIPTSPANDAALGTLTGGWQAVNALRGYGAYTVQDLTVVGQSA